MNEQLTEGERTVLKGLLSLGKKVPSIEIAKITKQQDERVISILNSLAERKMVTLDIHESVSYLLTEEGKEYLEKGLPEFRLFSAIRDLGGKVPFDDAVKKAELGTKSKGIAMSWAKRNGWIAIGKDDGKTILTTVTDEISSPVAEALKILTQNHGKSDQIDTQVIQQLLDRNLVEVEKSKRIHAEISERFRENSEDLLVESTDSIGDLTP